MMTFQIPDSDLSRHRRHCGRKLVLAFAVVLSTIVARSSADEWTDAYGNAKSLTDRKAFKRALPDAKRAFRIAVNEDPKSDERMGFTYLLLAKIYWELEDWTKASSQYGSAFRHLKEGIEEDDERWVEASLSYGDFKCDGLVRFLRRNQASSVEPNYERASRWIFNYYDRAIATNDIYHDLDCVESQELRRYVARKYLELIRGLRVASSKRGSLKDERTRETDEKLKAHIESLEERISVLKEAIAQE